MDYNHCLNLLESETKLSMIQFVAPNRLSLHQRVSFIRTSLARHSGVTLKKNSVAKVLDSTCSWSMFYRMLIKYNSVLENSRTQTHFIQIHCLFFIGHYKVCNHFFATTTKKFTFNHLLYQLWVNWMGETFGKVHL